MRFKAKDSINERYTVVFPIKQGSYAETYRVKDAAGKRYFFKLIDDALVQPHQRDANNHLRELTILSELDHPNLPRFVDDGALAIDGRNYSYLVTEFVSSETVSDRLMRSSTLSVHDTKAIAMGVLSALKHLHDRPDPIIHNEVTALNTLIDLTTEDLSKVVLIDFGYARHQSEAVQQSIEGLNWFYLAPECFDGASTPQSDLYALGAMVYQLIFGMLLWFCDLSNVAPDRRKQFILKQKNTELLMPFTEKFEMDNQLLNVMRKALAADPDERFQSAGEMMEALKGNITVTPPTQSPATAADRADAFSARREGGNGFADVAGMDQLKQMLTREVLVDDSLHDASPAHLW